MSQSPEWITLAARELLAKDIVPSDAHAEAARLIIEANCQAYAAHLAKLDASGLAERIRLQICAATYAAEGGDWSNTSDEAIDAAINYWLAPLLEQRKKDEAEIERLTGQLAGCHEFNQRLKSDIQVGGGELLDTIKQMAEVLRECREPIRREITEHQQAIPFHSNSAIIQRLRDEVSGGLDILSRIDTILAAMAGEVGE